jgi:YbbR domain-containing protein
VVTITGPKSKIETIDSAIASVDVTGIMKDFTKKSNFIIYDKNGSKFDLTNCKLNIEKIDVKGIVYETKLVNLKVSAVDSKMDNCEVNIDDLKLSKNEVLISAPSDILENTNELNISIDVSANLTNKINSIIDLNKYLSENIYIVDKDNTVELNMNISRFLTSTIEFNGTNIKINGGNAIFNDEKYTVDITYKSEIDNVSIDMLSPYIDIEKLSKGKYNLQIKFKNIDGISIINNPSANIVIK